MDKSRKLFANYLLSVLNTVLSLIFPIITFPYVSRVLGSTNLGIVNFTQSYGYYFIHIANFGISSYAVREISKVRDDPALLDRKANEIFNLNLVFSVCSWTAYLIGMVCVGKFRENWIAFLVYSTIILTNFLSLEWLLQSFDDYFFATIRSTIIRVLLLVAVFLFVHDRNDYVVYVAITTFSEMGTRLSTLTYSRKYYVKLRIGRTFLNFRDHFAALFTLFSFRLVNGISAQLDKLMIGFMCAYSDVGVYSAGVKFVLLVIPIIESIGTVMFPTMNIAANESRDKYMNALAFNYKTILMMGIPMSMGLFLMSPFIINTFVGVGYDGAVSVARIMSIVILLCPLGDMLGSKTLLIYNKNKQLFTCSTIVAVSNIVLNTALIPLGGINGAAIASVISYIIAIGARLYYTKKILPFKLFNISLVKYTLFTVPFIVLYLLFHEQIDTDVVGAIIYIAACCVIYGVELLVSKDEIGSILIDKMRKKKG